MSHLSFKTRLARERSPTSSLSDANMLEMADKIGTNSRPQNRIEATILDLNGNPIRPNNPTPVLRRSNLGHLFQPRNEVVKAAEMMDPVPVTRHKARNIVTVKEPKRGNGKKKATPQKSAPTPKATRESLDEYMKIITLLDAPCAAVDVENVRFQKPVPTPKQPRRPLSPSDDYFDIIAMLNQERTEVNVEEHDVVTYLYDDVFPSAALRRKAAKSTSSAVVYSGTTSKPAGIKPLFSISARRSNVARSEVHDCRNEDPHHRCLTKELVDYGRPDSETLEGFGFDKVSAVKTVDGVWNDADIWMQIAREM